MEKKLIRIDIGEQKEYDAEYSVCDEEQEPIDNVINFLVEAKNKGATHVDFGGSINWEDRVGEVHIQPFLLREETDDEFSKRTEKENSVKTQKEVDRYNTRRKLYEELKKEFESN